MFGIGKKDQTETVDDTQTGESLVSSAETEESTSPASDASSTESITSTEPNTEDSAPLAPTPDPEPAPEGADVAPPPSDVSLSDEAKEALSSDEFHDFIATEILQFLAIMDISHPNTRRAAVIECGPSEEKIAARIALSNAFLHLLAAYAASVESENIAQEALDNSTKLAAMKKWLTI